MKMIEVENITDYVCPHCGYINRDRKGKDIECPKCNPKSKGWSLKKIEDAIEKEREG